MAEPKPSRRPLIVANWKMNKTVAETESFVTEFLKHVPLDLDRDAVVCPPFTGLAAAARVLSGSRIGLGAQDLSEHAAGAYTGEVAAPMLTDVGCRYVIVGHSERRQYHAETDALVNKKARAALASDLIPIVCVGETLQEREANETLSVIRRQVSGGLEGLPSADVQRLVIAYEPVWAIGTGRTATPGQAQDVHFAIRDVVKDQYGSQTSHSVRILYGGSVKPENMAELMEQADIDGGLVGGASLKADSFLKIVCFGAQRVGG